MSPTLVLARIVWRHSAVGWVGLALVALLMWLPTARIVQVGTGGHAGAARDEPALLWSMICGFLILMAAGLAGAAIDRIRSRAGLVQVVPALALHVHRLLWSCFGLFWLLAGTPGVLIAGPGGAWWALPWSLGLAGLAMSWGLAVTALGVRMRMFGYGLLVLGAATNMFWRPWVSSAAGSMNMDAATLHALVATAGVVLFAVWGWTARAIALRMGAAGAPARNWQQYMSDSQMRLLSPAGAALVARDPRWLAMPMAPPTLRRELGTLAFNAVVLLVSSHWFASQAAAMGWLPYFVFLAAWAASPHINGVWVSPRILLLPHAGRRAGMAPRLFLHALGRTLPRAAMHAGVAATALCLGGQFSAADAVVWLLAAMASLPFEAAAALAAVHLGRGQGARSFWAMGANLVFLVTLALLGHFGFDLPLVGRPVSPGWALLSLALSALLAAALLALIARPWARLDWARMPASPVWKSC